MLFISVNISSVFINNDWKRLESQQLHVGLLNIYLCSETNKTVQEAQ